MYRTYTTNRLLIKNLDASHALQVLDFFYKNRAFFEPWDQTRSNAFYTVVYQKKLLTLEKKLWLNGSSNRFYLFEKSNPNKIIGSINFYNIEHFPLKSCKLGYKLAADAIHKNYAYEALSFLIPLVAKNYSLSRIEVYIMPSNERSIHLAQRLNFNFEGHLNDYCEINGQRETHNLYTRLFS